MKLPGQARGRVQVHPLALQHPLLSSLCHLSSPFPTAASVRLPQAFGPCLRVNAPMEGQPLLLLAFLKPRPLLSGFFRHPPLLVAAAAGGCPG